MRKRVIDAAGVNSPIPARFGQQLLRVEARYLPVFMMTQASRFVYACMMGLVWSRLRFEAGRLVSSCAGSAGTGYSRRTCSSGGASDVEVDEAIGQACHGHREDAPPGRPTGLGGAPGSGWGSYAQTRT